MPKQVNTGTILGIRATTKYLKLNSLITTKVNPIIIIGNY